MKKRTLAIGLSVLLLCFAFPLTAAAESVDAVKIDVVLDEVGAAHVTEVWQIDATQGTEWYLNKDNMGDMEILDFTVSDETGQEYIDEGAWDVDRTREEKAGKYGIVETEDGYELCWGLGDYGERTYTISYIMTNFAKSYTDYDGFNIRFINDKTSSAPAKVDLRIHAPQELTPDNTGVWAFGFDGEIYAEDGAVHAWTNEPLQQENHVTVMVRLDQGILAPTSRVNRPFSDLEEQAKEGSEYKKESPLWIPVLILLGLCGLAALIVIVIKRSGDRFMGLERVRSKDVEYCREIPCAGNLPACYALLKGTGMAKTDGAIIGAYLLRWSYQNLAQIKQAEKASDSGKRSEKQPSIVLKADVESLVGSERSLYEMLRKASGGDRILQEKELYKWSEKHYKKVDAWLEELNAEGRRKLRETGDIAWQKTKWFWGLIRSDETVLTQQGKLQVRQLLGFQKYLKDFTIVNERKAVEVELWDEYLVFAVLFGIADEVAKEFKALYPSRFESQGDLSYDTGNDLFWTMMMVQNMSHAASRGTRAGRTMEQLEGGGGGGFSSMGGGGGFSGGGSGGGSR